MLYSEHQAKTASDKVALVVMEASLRQMGWALYSGSVYSVSFSWPVISSIEENGTALTSVASIAAISSAGKYYLDTTNKVLYLRATDSSNPNTRFIACAIKLFFSNFPIRTAYDLSTGFDVEWLPYLIGSSQFGVEIDNYYQFGNALEGSGDLTFLNTVADSTSSQDNFWQTYFDKLTFENQKVLVYSWSRELPITEAKLIYRGRVHAKSWAENEIKFQLSDTLNELKAPVDLSDLADISGARLPDSFSQLKQRQIYGRVFGVKLINYDQVLDGYPATGTVAVTNGSANVSGSSTQFFLELSPDDQIWVGGIRHTVKSVTSQTAFVLTEVYANGTESGSTMYVIPSIPKRWMNRKFSICGHAISEPETTVSAATNPMFFECADLSGFKEGDSVLVGTDVRVIDSVSDTFLRLTQILNDVPIVGTAVKRIGISNVYIDDRLLTRTTDYTYNASAGTLLLDELAEFNVAPVQAITGTVAFTNTSRTVTGTGTFFKKDTKPGDWLNRSGQEDWFEILSVDSDTQVTLRTEATYTSSGASFIKKPTVYQEGKVVLSADICGATDDGLTTGAILQKCGSIVSDLITNAGLSSLLSASTFTTADSDNEADLGIVIPTKFNEKKIPSYRDVINLVNQSVFGTLVQNEDFQLEYQILQPSKSTSSSTVFKKEDVLGFSVTVNSDRLIKTVFVNYKKKEYDPVSNEDSFSQASATSDDGQYLSKTSNELTIETNIVDTNFAQIYANRWAFILSVGTSVISILTKLQGARLQATDQIEIDHNKLYERIASSDRRRIGAIRGVKKSASDVTIEVEDLGNALSRCGSITDSSQGDFSSSTDQEVAYAGFITDSYGMQDNDPDTFGRDLIW